MTRLSFLRRSTFSIIIIGILCALIPFCGSLRPSAKVQFSTFKIDISEFSIGEYRLIPHPIYQAPVNGYSMSLFVYKDQGGAPHVWNVPTRDGRVGLPDRHWWRPYYSCLKFGPFIVDSEVVITCNDNLDSHPKWLVDSWQWSVDGKATKEYTEDLWATKGAFRGKYFFVGE